MTGAMIALIAVGAVAFFFVLWVVGVYNALVTLRNQVKNAWAQIDVQLKRRWDLIPNLIETVKGYTKHEAQTLERVTAARGAAQGVPSGDIAKRAAAESELSSALGRLMVVVEAYPDLKANTNYLALQEELTSTENKIAFSRQFYNDIVYKFNTRQQLFPTNIIAGMFGFKPSDLFELKSEEQREAPKVQF